MKTIKKNNAPSKPSAAAPARAGIGEPLAGDPEFKRWGRKSKLFG